MLERADLILSGRGGPIVVVDEDADVDADVVPGGDGGGGIPPPHKKLKTTAGGVKFGKAVGGTQLSPRTTPAPPPPLPVLMEIASAHFLRR